MEIINYTEVRDNFETVLNRIADDEDHIVIFKRDAKDFVIMSVRQYNGLLETLHLLSSPKNARRLNKSIAALRREYEGHDPLDP